VEEATPSLTLIIRDEGLRLLTAVGAPEVSNACGESVRPGEIQAGSMKQESREFYSCEVQSDLSNPLKLL